MLKTTQIQTLLRMQHRLQRARRQATVRPRQRTFGPRRMRRIRVA